MPDPTFTPKSTTVVYRVQIEGAEPIALAYGKSNFRPVKAEITYRDGKPEYLKLSGPNVKKDGTDGQNAHENNYSLDSRWQDGPPPWCESLIKSMQSSAAHATA